MSETSSKVEAIAAGDLSPAPPAVRAEEQERSLRAARALAVPVFLMAAIASLAGLLAGGEGPISMVNGWGRSVELAATGIYARDSASAAVQEKAQDLVTSAFALPLLAAGWVLSRRGGLGGRLLLAGALGYFLYCYGMMSVGTAYNAFFLVYVALFASSLWGFVMAFLSIDARELAARCASSFPRRSMAALCIAMALFLGLNWIGGIVLPALLAGREPSGLDSYHTLAVQALDLGILCPAGAVAAFWLLRRDPRGYLLGGVVAVKGSAEGLAVAAMGFNMIRTGVASAAESLPLVLGFLALALSALVIGAFVLRSAGIRPEDGQPRKEI